MEAVPEDMPLPKNRRLRSGRNPEVLKANIPAFERLLMHNRKAKIVWAHVGWCNTGQRTVSLIAELLKKHPNLYMSFKISPRDSFPENCPIERGRGLKAEWINLIREFPDRFVIGSDQFYLSPRMHGQIGPRSVEPTHRFLSLLPPDLAHKVGFENAERLFNLHVR
jgi:predicted TIM-barrel fold metal-dependent hydrolase